MSQINVGALFFFETSLDLFLLSCREAFYDEKGTEVLI